MHTWNVYKKFDQAAKAAAELIAKNIISTIKNKGVCHVVLPGGNTPILCLGYLAKKEIPWHKVHWYLGDERCYSIGHSERNDMMLEKYFWSSLSNTNIHRIPAELGAEAAAENYRKTINSVGSIDIAFLGMGEDGHTASLFPNNKALQDSRSVVPVYDSPKPPAERVSLGIKTLRKAQQRVVLVGGNEKAPIIQRIKSGESLPINCIGDIDWYVDDKAFSATI